MYRQIEDIQAEINECSRERLSLGQRLKELQAARDEQDRIKHSSKSSENEAKEASERKSQILQEIGELTTQIQQLEKADYSLNVERRDAENHEISMAWRIATPQSLKHEKSSVISQLKSVEAMRNERLLAKNKVINKIREIKSAISALNKLKEKAADMRAEGKRRKAIGFFADSEANLTADDELLSLEIEIESQQRTLADSAFIIEEGERQKAQILSDEDALRDDIQKLKTKYWQINKKIALKKYEASIKPLLSALSEVVACDQILGSDTGLKMLAGMKANGLLVQNADGSVELSELVSSFESTNPELRNQLERELDELITTEI